MESPAGGFKHTRIPRVPENFGDNWDPFRHTQIPRVPEDPAQAAESAITPTLTWMTRIGNRCVILVVCWLGCQLWYTGARVLETRGSSISLGTFCRVLCCGMAALLVKPNYEPVREDSEEKEEPRDQEQSLINLGAVWKNESPEACRAVGLLGSEGSAKPSRN